MKKEIVQQLRKAAESTPVIFEWTTSPSVFTGEEMNLSAFGETQKFDKDKHYTVDMPTMVAVDHHQQFKDAFKRGGWPAVKEYHSKVMEKLKTAKKVS